MGLIDNQIITLFDYGVDSPNNDDTAIHHCRRVYDDFHNLLNRQSLRWIVSLLF